eukprot:TRINITY_DN5886_c0_g1_i1.p2 TRINITY_DN5886_c0_g1~~TRINITY_DN5886_c0_g1_i1.p2  ORF type:complete len:285 (+),score=56.79 TRINITY_DN5886_c0_g1_i1:379-1233(+)
MNRPVLLVAAVLCALLPLALCTSPFRSAVAPFPITCALVLCPANTRCIQTARGPQCVPRPFPPPSKPSCATILCIEGTRCVEAAQGAQCVPIEATPPPVHPTPQPSSCDQLQCDAHQLCIETPAGAQCQLNTGCAAVTCALGFQCVVKERGAVCERIQTPPPSLCACIQVFDPVCCRFADGSVRTAGNSCECNGCDSANEIVSEGACAPSSCAAVDCAPGFECVIRDGIAQCVESDSCVCAEVYDPVCCRSANGIITKSNTCFCACEPSGSVLFNGRCPTFDSH